MSTAARTILLISQTYVPDPAAVGQYMHDAAAEMVRRGYRVKVYASSRGYDDPSQVYPKRQILDGVEIRRLPLSSFGKASIPIRLLGGFIFVAQVVCHAIWLKRIDGILVSTSPPMASLAAVALQLIRRAPATFWAMDINPDQMIAMGKTSATSLPAKAFDAINRMILRRAHTVVALDRFMAERLERKTPVGDRMVVAPPWPHGDLLEPVDHHDNPFRHEHQLQDHFVLMYSGNISPAHPIDTLLQAARSLSDQGESRILFLFIGGGLARKQIEDFVSEHRLPNIKTLPYQPLDRIKYSLSAADVHLVAMGDPMVGIVHPCKIYGALAVHRPVLLLGPERCHAGEIIEQHQIGWTLAHGDIDGAVELIQRIAAMDRQALQAMGQRSGAAARSTYSVERLRGIFCDALQRMLG